MNPLLRSSSASGLPRTRLLLSPSMVAFCALLLLLWGLGEASEAQAAGQLQIVAHEDDDLYFMTPAVPDGISSGAASWTVFLTAGDAGRTDGHWQSRELGIQATYAEMAGQANVWSPLALNVNDRNLAAFQLNGASQVVVVFLRMPDGNPGGTGYGVTGNESLRYLWEGSIGTIHSIDGAHTYTRTELVEMLYTIIRLRDPDTLRIQDMTAYHGSDHSDHFHSGRFAFQAHLESAEEHQLRAYRAYNIQDQPVNLSPAEIAESNSLITTYGAFDPGVGPHPWNQREIPIADARKTHASLVLMGSALGEVCLAARDVATPAESLVFETCADVPEQAFYLTERDIRHGTYCLVSPAISGGTGSLGFAPCGVGAGQGWMFFTDGHIRGLDDQCVSEVGGALALESCSGSSRTWEVGAKPAFAAAMGSEFSNLELGVDPSRYASLEFGDLNQDGQDDVCVRRADGIYCALAQGGGLFGAATLWHPNFGDGDLWGPPQHGTTMAMGDLDGDGRADLCGRGIAGVFCVRSNGASFFDFRLWTSVFSDADGGAVQETYGSIRLADVTGDARADLCGMRVGEVQCLASDGVNFGAATTWMNQDWIGLLGLPAAQIGQTIMFGDVDGDGDEDLCERGVAGVYCAMADPAASAFLDPAMRSQAEFSDAFGWGSAEGYWHTLRLGDFSGDGQADLCGRGAAGILCLYSIDGRSNALNHRLTDAFSNAAGFLPTEIATTFSMADVDGDGHADLCAAGPTQFECAVLDDPLAAPEPGFGMGLGLGLAGLRTLRRRPRETQTPTGREGGPL